MPDQSFARLSCFCKTMLLCAGAWLSACGGGQQSAALPASCPARNCLQAVGLDANNACRYAPLTDGTSCDTGSVCSHYATCTAGVCGGGVASPDGTPCDDQNACTVDDACYGGVCVGPNALVCPAADACHGTSTCDPKLGCSDAALPACVEGLPSIPLTGCVDNVYTAPVTLGTQTFQLLCDTGSSTTAVAASTCSNCNVTPTYALAANQATFGTTRSLYTDQSAWSGSVVQDTGLPQAALTANNANAALLGPAVNFRFAAITAQQNTFFAGAYCTGTYDLNAYQGILGLGPQGGAVAGTQAFLDSYVAAGGLPNDAFSLQLCYLGGQLWLGGYDPNAVQSPPIFTPMLGTGHAGYLYAVALDDLALGQTSLDLPSASYGVSVLDTGTGPLLLPQVAYDAFVKQLQADPNFATLAALGLYANANALCVTPSPNLTPQQLDAALSPLVVRFPSLTSTAATGLSLSATQSYLTVSRQSVGGVDQYTYCTAVYPSTSTTLGAAVLRGLTVVFDRAGQKIGFAPQSGCSGNLPRLPAR